MGWDNSAADDQARHQPGGRLVPGPPLWAKTASRRPRVFFNFERSVISVRTRKAPKQFSFESPCWSRRTPKSCLRVALETTPAGSVMYRFSEDAISRRFLLHCMICPIQCDSFGNPIWRWATEPDATAGDVLAPGVADAAGEG